MEIVVASSERLENEREIGAELQAQIELYAQIAERVAAAHKESERLRAGLERLADTAQTIGSTIAGAFGAQQLDEWSRQLARTEQQIHQTQTRAYRRAEEAAKNALERMDQDRERAFARLTQNQTARFSSALEPLLNLARRASEIAAAETENQHRQSLQAVENALSTAQERLRQLEEMRKNAEGDEKDRLEREIVAQRQGLAQLAADRELYERRRDEALKKAGQVKKAVAVAETIANTAVAVTKALAEGGPTLGPILAGVVAALGAAQTATVAVQQFSKGTLAVKGGIPGKDSVPALLTPGEAVIPAPEARDYRAVLQAIHARQIPPDEMHRRLFQNVHVSIDERGFKLFVRQSDNETRFLDRRYRTYDS
jgi:hypothetical protein